MEFLVEWLKAGLNDGIFVLMVRVSDKVIVVISVFLHYTVMTYQLLTSLAEYFKRFVMTGAKHILITLFSMR